MVSNNDTSFLRILTLKQLAIVLGVPLEILNKYSTDSPKSHYVTFPKMVGSKIRKLTNPDPGLKAIQRKINSSILQKYPLPDEFYGGVKKRDIVGNASKHLGKSNVSSVDIKNFFPSIPHGVVFKMYRELLGFSQEVSSMLTKLTTYRYCVPQGTPTSTMVANLCLVPTKEKIRKLLPKNINLSFLVDDITFSGDGAYLYIESVIRILQKAGYSVRDKKIESMGSAHRQVATKLTVNKRISVPKPTIKKYVLDAKNDTSIEKASTMGRINFVKHVSPRQGRRFERKIQKR